MTFDTSDLRAVLRDHADAVTGAPDLATRAAALGRRTQRRRAAGGVGAVAVVVAGILAITQQSGGTHRATVPVAPKGLATYASGMKLITGRQGAAPLDFDVRLPVTADGKPTQVGFTLACASPDADHNSLEPEMELSIDGKPEGGVTGCSKTLPVQSSVTVTWDPKDRSFASGSLLHVHVALKGKQPPQVELRAGVYAAVPLRDYVFPPRPDNLTPVTGSLADSAGRSVGTIKAAGPTSLVVHPRHGLHFNTTTSEPGQLDIFVNDKLVDTATSWTYDESAHYGASLSLAKLGLKPGQAARVRVVATRFTGHHTWLVDIKDSASS